MSRAIAVNVFGGSSYVVLSRQEYDAMVVANAEVKTLLQKIIRCEKKRYDNALELVFDQDMLYTYGLQLISERHDAAEWEPIGRDNFNIWSADLAKAIPEPTDDSE